MSNDSSVLVTGNPAALSRLAMLEASRAASSVSTRGAQHFFGGPSRRSARWAQPCPHRTTPGRLAGPGLQPQRCLRGRAAPHFRNKIINAGAVIAFEKGGSWPRQQTRDRLEQVLRWPPGTITHIRDGGSIPGADQDAPRCPHPQWKPR